MKTNTNKNTAETKARELYKLVHGQNDEFNVINPGYKRGWLKLGKAVLTVENKWTEAKERISKLEAIEAENSLEMARLKRLLFVNHLLSCLAEECCEVGQLVSKSIRFGLDDKNILNPEGPTNLERLISEMNDYDGVAGLLRNEGILPRNWEDSGKADAKIEKVMKFVRYAKEKGLL